MPDPVRVEQVGGTAATNPFHDHRVMLVSPEIAELVAVALGIGVHPARMREIEGFLDAWEAAPRVHADEDAIRWLCERQARGAT